MRNKIVSKFIIGTFVTLYIMVSLISTVHVIEFFRLSNPEWLAISLAIAFEIGAAASLASLIILKKMNKGLIWTLFILLTLMQAMGNTYYSFMHLENFSGWIELFNLVDEEILYQKRVLSIISGAILPLIALGFIKSLVDYIKPAEIETEEFEELEKELEDLEEELEELENEVEELEELEELEEELEEKLEELKKDSIVEVDGGNSSMKSGMISPEHHSGIISPEHHSGIDDIDSIKRYPENLE